MSLETTLTDITARLRQGRFPNEQAISQGIVLRVLQEAGWDIYLPAEQGSHEDRRVYKLDLFERPPTEAAVNREWTRMNANKRHNNGMNCRERTQRAQRPMRSVRSFAANRIAPRPSTFVTRHFASRSRNRRSQACVLI